MTRMIVPSVAERGVFVIRASKDVGHAVWLPWLTYLLVEPHPSPKSLHDAQPDHAPAARAASTLRKTLLAVVMWLRLPRASSPLARPAGIGSTVSDEYH